MENVIILMLVFLVCMIVTFAISFSGTTLFIRWRQRTKKKYYFTEPAEMYSIKREEELSSVPYSLVDGDSALKEFVQK